MSNIKIPLKLNKIVSYLSSQRNDILAIYLYGSYAKEMATINSDIDIAILTKKPCSSLEIYEYKTNLELLIHTDIDLTNLNKASTVLQMQIVAYAQSLYEDDVFNKDEYENRIFQDYVDYRDDIKPLLEEINQTGTIYG